MTNAELRAKWEQLHSDVGERKGLPLEIRDSWERSRAFAVNRHFRENPYIATRAELNEARNRAEFMIEKSASVMNGLYEFVAGTGFVVLLGDVNLCLLKVVGDRESLAFAQRARLVEGSMWSERLVGTNAGALAYDLAKPVSVFGYQHFCLFSHVAACSCAPILDEDRIVGVLGLSAPYNRVSNHTLGMVVASTKHIKAKMAMERARRYHEVLTDSIQEGLFAIDINGNITFANKNCAETLRMGRETLFGRNIYELLGHSPDNLYFINRITSGRSSDENYSLTIGRKTVRFNATCCPLNDPDSTEKGAVIVVRENRRIKQLVSDFIGGGAKITFQDIVGQDRDFQQCIKTASAAASSLSNVLLQGESGTGKDIIAQAMHNASPRRNNAFLAINCAALPRELIASELFGYEEGAFTGARKGGNMGKFELADQGTLFLDEIGDMPLDLQASLLRVLEEKTIMRLGGTKRIPINVRVIAATNQDLETMIENGRFRRDLYYRLGVIRINIPPLRSRKADILLIAEHLVEKCGQRFDRPLMSLTPEVKEAFVRYHWPGNIREMQNVIEGAIQLSSDQVISYDLVSSYLAFKKPQPAVLNRESESTIHDLEKQMILEYMEKYKYNKTRVASALGISRRTLYRRMKEFEIVT